MSSDPIPSAAIYDATTGGRSVIVVTGGSTGDVLTLQADGTYDPVAPAGGVTGTGAVDNAVLRADGTGGATLQSSAIVIADNYTASPNNTVNHASLQVTGDTSNVSVSLVPKGSGSFSLAVPDGTSTGGNARGNNAVDLQTSRAAANQVASGADSVAIGVRNRAGASQTIAIGYGNTVTGLEGKAIGYENTVSGSEGNAIGLRNTVSGNDGATAIGDLCTSSSAYALATGGRAVADRYGQRSHSCGNFAAAGDAQYVRFVARRVTTDATPTTLMLNGASTRLTIPSGKILFADILISGIKSDGSAAACYKRKVAIKNVAGTTALVGTVETIGTDIEDNAACDVAITADNTNDALDISVTGIAAETWRWVAVVDGLEIAYGT